MSDDSAFFTYSILEDAKGLRYWTAKSGQMKNYKSIMKGNLVLNASKNEFQSLAITGGHLEIRVILDSSEKL